MDCKMMTVRSFLKAIAGAVALVGMVALAQAEDKSDKVSDPSGTWTWTTPGRNGGADRTTTLTLKRADDKSLAGSISTPGRGGAPNKTDISNVKLEGNTISFEVSRERQGATTTTIYKGTLTGDTITGKVKVKDSDRPERDWTAKRSTTTGS
jgi:hypothetical protein